MLCSPANASVDFFQLSQHNIAPFLKQNIEIKGMAHITGGGFLDNIPRILPASCDVELYVDQLPKKPIFSLLCDIGKLDEQEKYRVFNMGIGLVLVISQDVFPCVQNALKNFKTITCHELGRVVDGTKKVQMK